MIVGGIMVVTNKVGGEIMDFSEELIIARAKMGWTQKELAEYLGVGTNTIWRWETLGELPKYVTIVRVGMKLKELENEN